MPVGDVPDFTGPQALEDARKLSPLAAQLLKTFDRANSRAAVPFEALKAAFLGEREDVVRAALAELLSVGVVASYDIPIMVGINPEPETELRYGLDNWGFFVAKALRKLEADPGRSPT